MNIEEILQTFGQDITWVEAESRYEKWHKAIEHIREQQREQKRSGALREILSPRQIRELQVRGALQKLPEDVHELHAIRMWSNWDYDPHDEFFSQWRDDCNAAYALMGDNEKLDFFWTAIKRYRVIGARKGKSIQNAAEAMRMADEERALYDDWILALCVECLPATATINHLKGKYAKQIYHAWMKSGKPVPAYTLLPQF